MYQGNFEQNLDEQTNANRADRSCVTKLSIFLSTYLDFV